MSKREMERRFRQPDLESLADLLDPPHPLDHVGGRGPVIVMGVGLEPGRQNARIEGPADHDANPPGEAERQEARKRVLLEQRIPAREHEHVEIALAGEGLGGLALVDPRADRLDGAGGAKFIERAIAALHELAEMSLDGFVVSVRGQIDVVREDDVDRIKTEALEREFERTHDAVVGIVEALSARRRFEESVRARALVRFADVEETANLGGDEEGVARPRPKEAVEAAFGQPEPIERRGVVIPAARRPDGLQHEPGFLLGDRAVQIPERGAAKSKLGKLELGPASRNELSSSHATPIAIRRHRAAPSLNRHDAPSTAIP